MNKQKKVMSEEDEMRPEYDFSGAKAFRGRYFRALREGHEVRIHKEDGSLEVRKYYPLKGCVVLDRDVREYFPDAESVNNALRSLIALFPKKVPAKSSSRRAARKAR